MISSLPSYDDELLSSAYANISLIADKAWTFDKDEPFRKLNQSLWIQCCKLSAKYKDHGNYRQKCVRDVIPNSRLAKYGNYEYNDEREGMYKPDNGTRTTEKANLRITNVSEPWMLADVEEHFARLTLRTATRSTEKPSSQFSNDSNSAMKNTEANRNSAQDEIQRHYMCNWSNALQAGQLMRERNVNVNNKKEIGGRRESFLTLENTEIERKRAETDGHQKHSFRRYTIESQAELQLYARVTCAQVRELWSNEAIQRRLENRNSRSRQQCYQQQSAQRQGSPARIIRQTRIEQNPPLNCAERQKRIYYSLHCQPLVIKNDFQMQEYPETYGLVRKNLPPPLSPEVPEFFPKAPLAFFEYRKEGNCGNPVQYFPSSSESNYQNELFPYNKAHEGTVFESTGISLLAPPSRSIPFHPSQQWIQRGHFSDLHFPISSTSHPVCASVQPAQTSTISQGHLQVNATPIPVYQRPMELYHEDTQRKKSQGVDFNNLILLTNNATKVRRSQPKSHQGTSLASERRQSNLKPVHGSVLQWLNKGGTKKTKEFVTVNALISEMRSFKKRDQGKLSGSWKLTDAKTAENTRIVVKTTDFTNPAVSESNANRHAKRRLYRDVLTNASSHNIILENVFEKRYDELEQQAVEQYRTSEESIALKYQELEQQAMEQYRTHANTTETKEDMQHGISNETQNDNRTHLEVHNFFDCKSCPRPGQCNPLKHNQENTGSNCDAEASSTRGTFLQPQITLLKPESKPNPSTTRRTMCHKSARPVIVSKSLTTLAQKVLQGSKNASKGASGDKVDKNVQASPKRRLILMSPFKHESEAGLMRTTTLKKICSLSHANRNILDYYHNSELVQSGSGDKNVTIIRSPAAKGTRSSLVKKQLYNVNYIPTFSSQVWLSDFWTA